jgi:hypothetical protein
MLLTNLHSSHLLLPLLLQPDCGRTINRRVEKYFPNCSSTAVRQCLCSVCSDVLIDITPADSRLDGITEHLRYRTRHCTTRVLNS